MEIYKMGRRISVLILFITLFSSYMAISIGATRILMEDFDNNSGHEYQPLYETAKDTVARWLQQLASGPSGGGGGH
ncbi:hypothetical protein RND81_05G125600 [Saponaria officinalis]|uniref:Uncharacterized protein n=1 Tax=Saponaria officinalis TaxID=3572 RepID=A0AAW1KV26_SAPOF